MFLKEYMKGYGEENMFSDVKYGMNSRYRSQGFGEKNYNDSTIQKTGAVLHEN